jgi:raffinose/stachyose/melibiose transport system permease protein
MLAAKPRDGFMFEGLLSGAGKTLLHIVLLGIGVIYLYPFIWMVGSSLKTDREFFSLELQPFPAGDYQWSSFGAAWEKANFSQYFLNTVLYSVSTTILVLLITSLAAYSLSRLRVPGYKLVIGLLGLTFFMPQGYTIIPVFRIVRDLGLLNTYGAVILVSTAGGMVLNTLLFYGYFRSIPTEIEEAAVIDGASIPQRYLRIVLPMSSPILATVGLFTFMNTWNDFFTPLIFTLAKPELRTLSVGMFNFVGQSSREWTLMCAAATISIVPVILIFILLQRYFVEAFMGAVKS